MAAPSPERPPVRIAPSLLAADFARLADEIVRVEQAGADWLHVDVMDGHFVPNLTIGPPVVSAMAEVASKPLDCHLMITDPFEYADRFLDAGVAGVTFHVELLGEQASHTIDEGRALLERIRSRGARAGISINPDGEAERLEPLLDVADLVLVMSVFPGFGGQSFMPEVLRTVRWLHDHATWRGEIEIDGGIGPDTIARAAAAGANVFVAGTSVFGAPDLTARIAELRELASGARPGTCAPA